MSLTATKKFTFDEFSRLQLDEPCELVDGRLEKLMSPLPKHGWSSLRIGARLDDYLEAFDAEGYWGSEVDIPTQPFHGRRPDFVYYSGDDAERFVDLEENRVLGPPTLAVEVTSAGDETRDEVTKLAEYALAGIRYYWILDPMRRTAVTYRLLDGEYVEEGRFSGSQALTSPLFPGLSIPLKKLFR